MDKGKSSKAVVARLVRSGEGMAQRCGCPHAFYGPQRLIKVSARVSQKFRRRERKLSMYISSRLSVYSCLSGGLPVTVKVD